MKLAPLIHTRTLNCDFNLEFLVRPREFTGADIKWARKAILEATTGIDGLQGERWVVVDNGKYRIAGVVGFTRNICKKAGIALNDEVKRLFNDDKGRLVYAFIGVVALSEDCFKNERLTYEYLWRQYEDNVGPVWEQICQPVILKEFVEVSLPVVTVIPQNIEGNRIGKVTFYETNSTFDKEIFQKYLLSKDKNFSFCSNLCDITAMKSSSYSAISTSNNIITRMRREQPSEKFSERAELKETISIENCEKKNSIQLASCLKILIGAIIILLLVIMIIQLG